MRDFDEFFTDATGEKPYPYQQRLAFGENNPSEMGAACQSLLIDIPTGMGKTAGVVLAWLWNRVEKQDSAWPRRLVFCLPMRTLVEQTEKNVNLWLKDLEFAERVRVEILMGGEEKTDWDIHPEENAILIGTQDMLLSRALNRGYGMSRYRWPMHFALLNNDCLWVMDETQLMGVGIETSAQLEGFRCGLGTAGFVFTWWMSATLDPAQLQTVDHPELPKGGAVVRLTDKESDLEAVRERRMAEKRLFKAPLAPVSAKKDDLKSYLNELASLVEQQHQPDSLTLVILNRVDRAQQLYSRLQKRIASTPLALIHSRFRPSDRKRHQETLTGEGGRIVIATQAVEAGVDVSARTLITELAPWSSLVQRFGRCHRYGEIPEGSDIYWIDLPTHDPKNSEVCLPYTAEELGQARKVLADCPDASPATLAGRAPAPPFVVRPVIRKRDLLDLFDTTPDLAGADIDISRYVRDGIDSDVQVYWRNLAGEAPETAEKRSARDEICRVSIGAFKKWLPKEKAKRNVWRWDFRDRQWKRADTPVPGQIYLIDVSLGGYHEDIGWTGEKKNVPSITATPGTSSSDDNSGDPTSRTTGDRWESVAAHTDKVVAALEAILENLPNDHAEILLTAARWHDWGKAHQAFQAKLSPEALADHQSHHPVAKAPDTNWKSSNLPKAPTDEDPRRPQFRHELASALAFLHPATETGLSEADRDLAAYLIATHHGKVRLSLRSMPGEFDPGAGLRFARGIWDGELLPVTDLGGGVTAPETALSLAPMVLGTCPESETEPFSGQPSWTSRTLGLRDQLGPFHLGYLETLLRAADALASK